MKHFDTGLLNLAIALVPAGYLAANCCLIIDKATNNAIVVDPGGFLEVEEYLNAHSLKPQMILNTHGHWDHVEGNVELQKKYQIPLYIHAEDELFLHKSEFNPQGLDGGKPDGYLTDGQIIEFGGHKIKVLHTPGHSAGCVCFLLGNVLIAGDTLFQRSIGRTDLYSGSFEAIINSIRQKLLVLPDATVVIPGHGPSTSIGEERNQNPYLR